jgi:hypothetical protein
VCHTICTQKERKRNVGCRGKKRRRKKEKKKMKRERKKEKTY